ncbi:fungal specific transcription factor domain-containing protein [Colletotrichum graminicola M1.001]|uniref:Fungal specific transcription factor domain-containing protein n=1 Tax=Colletotrichum graminicola (strain M1.001 / M2 / FGSC 10212) TaxID=645133 RepID=E3Q9C8_COLGM|nr:fungal specific transcription factor domain-containing protein [Colletotrichum graminicola M1.001]EFQ27307.1 fungal specific transcription factor domain-containing protein [Colletotrichum graminicola M1.001]
MKQRDDQRFDPGRIFYNQARSLIPDVIERSCVSASYVYMGLALRKALAIGLHQEPDESAFSPEEQEARRRLWWSIYSLERTMTIKLNRPRSISQDIISARLPRRMSRDSVQKFDNVQHQIANATFVLIIDKLSQPGAWSRINQTPSASENFNSWNSAQDSLKKWKKDLPPSIRLLNVDPKSSSYRTVFHLHLNYYFASIDMGKVSVVTVVKARLRAAFRPQDEPQSISKDVERSSDACVKAAKKMIELFECLYRSGNLARFSFTDFQGCSIATIILLLAGILTRDSGYEGRIAFGLDCLRRMACGGNVTAQVGVRFIETLRSITNEARSKFMATQQGQEKSSDTSAEETVDYLCWEEWLANAKRVHDASEGESEQEFPELTVNVTRPLSLRHGMQTAPWDESEASQLENVLTSGFSLPMDSTASLHTQQPVAAQSSEDLWMPSFTWTNDQTYLMGLTGMGVLDFTDLS